MRCLPKFKRRNHKNNSRVVLSSDKMPEISPKSALKEPKHKESTLWFPSSRPECGTLTFMVLFWGKNVIKWLLLLPFQGTKYKNKGSLKGPPVHHQRGPCLTHTRVLNEYVSAGDYVCWRASHQQSLQAPHKIDPADSWIMWRLCGPWCTHRLLVGLI